MAEGSTGPVPGRGEPSSEDTGTTRGEDQLAVGLSTVARDLQRSTDPSQLLHEVVAAALRLVPGAEEGSIADVVKRSTIEHRAATSDMVRRIDRLMEETGQGPCLDSVWEQRTVRVVDLAEERRWPRFAARAAELGARSMLSFQLYVEGDNLGALNLYSRTPGSFTDESEHVGLLFAAHAAVAYASAQKQQELEHALDSRDLIGRAIGILMERHHLTGVQAFAVLTKYSQQANRKLRDIAAAVVRDAEAAARR